MGRAERAHSRSRKERGRDGVSRAAFKILRREPCTAARWGKKEPAPEGGPERASKGMDSYAEARS